MATSTNQITATDMGGFYYTDQITGIDTGELTASKIVGVADGDPLEDERINEVRAYHVRPKIVRIMGK